jgi:anti-sigma-K factor RskA
MTTKPSDELGPDSGAYVLHALSDAENARFEAELARSEEARAEVTELADTAVELGLSIAPVEPPAALRGRILDRLATTPQLAPLGTPDVAAPVESAQPAGPAEERARRRWTARPVSAIIAVAAAAALIFGGGIAVNSVIKGQQATATASQIGTIQAAADYRRATVPVATGGTATLIWSASLKRSAVVVHGMDKLPGGKTYELWYLDKAGATPAGTFDASDSTQSVVLTGAMKAGDTVGVTVEPSGGSRSPTTAPIAVIETA